MSAGITGSYRGEGSNVSTGNGGGAPPPDVPAGKLAEAGGAIGRQRSVTVDRIGRLYTDGGPYRASAAINVSSADQVLDHCTRGVWIQTAGANLVVRLADDSADVTFTSIGAGFFPLAIAIVRKTGTTVSGVLLF